MEDIRTKYVPPALSETSFNCPHCGALAKQFWHEAYASKLDKDQTPFFVDDEQVQKRLDEMNDLLARRSSEKWLTRMATGRPHFFGEGERLTAQEVANLSISECYN